MQGLEQFQQRPLKNDGSNNANQQKIIQSILFLLMVIFAVPIVKPDLFQKSNHHVQLDSPPDIYRNSRFEDFNQMSGGKGNITFLSSYLDQQIERQLNLKTGKLEIYTLLSNEFTQNLTKLVSDGQIRYAQKHIQDFLSQKQIIKKYLNQDKFSIQANQLDQDHEQYYECIRDLDANFTILNDSTQELNSNKEELKAVKEIINTLQENITFAENNMAQVRKNFSDWQFEQKKNLTERQNQNQTDEELEYEKKIIKNQELREEIKDIEQQWNSENNELKELIELRDLKIQELNSINVTDNLEEQAQLLSKKIDIWDLIDSLGGKEQLESSQFNQKLIKKQQVKVKIFDFYLKEQNYNEIPHLKDEYKNFMKQQINIKRQIYDIQKNIHDEQPDSLKSQYNQIIAQINAKKNLIQGLQREIQNLSQSIKLHQNHLDVVQQQINDWKQQASDLQKYIEENKKYRTNISDEMIKLEKINLNNTQKFQNKIVQIGSQIKNYSQKLTESQSTKNNLEIQNEKLQSLIQNQLRVIKQKTHSCSLIERSINQQIEITQKILDQLNKSSDYLAQQDENLLKIINSIGFQQIAINQ